MFLITRNNESNPDHQNVAFVADVTEEEGGVSCWMGFFQDSNAKPIVAGMVVENWMIFQRPSAQRTNLTVTKVNRKTFRAVAKDDGIEYMFRVDR